MDTQEAKLSQRSGNEEVNIIYSIWPGAVNFKSTSEKDSPKVVDSICYLDDLIDDEGGYSKSIVARIIMCKKKFKRFLSESEEETLWCLYCWLFLSMVKCIAET